MTFHKLSFPLILLVYTMLLASSGCVEGTNDSSRASSTCIDLKNVRYFDPPIYRENAIGGVEVWWDAETMRLSIHATFAPSVKQKYGISNGSFESDDKGETWRIVPTDTHMMNEDILQWPKRNKTDKYQYRTVAKGTKPYIDYFGMRRVKRWFIERSEDGGRTWKQAQGHILRSCDSIDGFMFLAYHPTDPKTFYISAPILGANSLVGLYETNDGAESFTVKLVGWSLIKMGVSNSNPAVMYATDEYGNIVKSENAGVNWHHVGQNDEIRQLVVLEKTSSGNRETVKPFGNEIYAIEVDPADSKTVYIRSKKGILKSADGGSTWCILNLGPDITTAVNSFVIYPDKPNLLFAGTGAGLYRSTDKGNSWDQMQIQDRIKK